MMLETPPEHPLEEIAQVFDTTHKEIWGSHPDKVVRLLRIETAEGMRIAEKNVELRKTFAKEYDIMAAEKATILERWAETEQMRGRIEGLTEGRIETLRAQLQNIQNIYSDQIAQLIAAPLRPLALHEAVYILERALEGRNDAFYARVKQDVLAILNGGR